MMRYWNYPPFGQGSETYNCQPYGAQSADFAHTLYDWANMPEQLTASSSYEEQLAVATLMYHVGVSLHMGYAPGGSGAAGLVGHSGTPSIDNSLKDYFHYSRNMRPIFRTNGYTDQQWADSLMAELRLRHPIVYCGVAPEGGHGFVCDGYEWRNLQVYFHINFGWSGNGDGYYTVDDICPNVSPTGQVGTVYHFNQSNQALLGAVPDYSMFASDTIVAFARGGGETHFFFCGNGSTDTPVATVDVPWARVSRVRVGDAERVTVTADSNDSNDERKGTIRFVQGDDTLLVQVVQTYYSEEDYCPLTVVMESTRNGGWEGGAHLTFESLSGYVYGTAALASGSSATVEVGVPPHDVNVVFHRGGGTDRYINYRVLNQHGEELIAVEYAFMNGGTHFIEWPCAHLDIAHTDDDLPHVWPNPANDVLHWEGCRWLRAELYDMSGRLKAVSADDNKLDVAILPAGVYILRLLTHGGVATIIVIKD